MPVGGSAVGRRQVVFVSINPSFLPSLALATNALASTPVASPAAATLIPCSSLSAPFCALFPPPPPLLPHDLHNHQNRRPLLRSEDVSLRPRDAYHATRGGRVCRRRSVARRRRRSVARRRRRRRRNRFESDIPSIPISTLSTLPTPPPVRPLDPPYPLPPPPLPLGSREPEEGGREGGEGAEEGEAEEEG